MASSNFEEPRWGAFWDGNGVRFSLHAPDATAVELCLFEDAERAHESTRVGLGRSGRGEWTAYVPDAGPGQLYGYRVDGPHDPERGLRFNPAKLLVDPYARALSGGTVWSDALLGYRPHSDQRDLSLNQTDSAPWAARSVVVDPTFDWNGDSAPRTSWADTVIYEAHIKGLTRQHPEVPRRRRGTYLGLTHPAVLKHLESLGVTAVELLPVFHSAAEPHLAAAARVNYWGYSPLSFFAPHATYATGSLGEQVVEFKQMVRALHGAGLEVILDVVYNHTAEGDEAGPTLSLRGIDNPGYYRLQPDHPRFYEDFTGTGNTLDLRQESTLALVIDSLRYWVEEMHVDGFRFDLAAMLGREQGAFDPESAFFTALSNEPSLAGVKLIAEPWDVGPDGYRLGGFPRGWVEWNDRYRDAVRAFWRGDDSSSLELARRIEGSPDIFPPRKRSQAASVNLVTCHDGFTLEDLVSYDHKHNWHNGEDSRDGHNHNLSRNWGVEGPTSNPEINRLRERAQRNMVATLALSRGIPMLGHGDELGRTQGGNNNAYCIDSPVTWVDWRPDGRRNQLLAFFQRVMQLRLEYPELTAGPDPKQRDSWLTPNGTPLPSGGSPWERTRAFARLIRGSEGLLVLLLNPEAKEIHFALPTAGAPWQELLNTDQPETLRPPMSRAVLPPYSLSLLASRRTRASTAVAGRTMRSTR